MKLYFFANIKNPAQLLLFQEVAQMMKKFGLTVYDNFKKQSEIEWGEQGAVDQIDAVILDASATEPEVGYLLAVAIAHKKPVLYLVPVGTRVDSSVDALAKNKEIKKYLRLVFFSQANFSKKIQEFLQYLDQDIGHELYSIKFTLRLTPKLERYLMWRSEKIEQNKANFVRDILEKMMKEDEGYKRRLE